MVIGILLIILDVMGTITGLIVNGGIVFNGPIYLIGKHLLLIIGIIIIIRSKNKT